MQYGLGRAAIEPEDLPNVDYGAPAEPMDVDNENNNQENRPELANQQEDQQGAQQDRAKK